MTDMTTASETTGSSPADEDASARESWLRALADRFPEHGVIVHDGAGRPVLASELAARILGHSVEAGAELDDHVATLGLVQQDGRSPLVGEHPVALALRGVETRDRLFCVKRPGGQLLPVLADAIPVLGPNGRVSGVLLMLRDLAEIERAQAFREAFLSRAGHELRTPLAALLTATQVLERRARKRGDPHDRALEIVVESVQHLRKLVEDILDLSRIGRGRLELRREATPLVPILRAGIDDACRARSLGVESVQLEGAELDVTAEWDPDRLRQIVRNLVENGLVHGRPPVRVRIDERAEDRVKFSVRDRGEGIPPERRGDVVRPFVRRDRDVGPGLGLAIASEIARVHGGRLTIGDDDGGGCAVFVELPTRAPR